MKDDPSTPIDIGYPARTDGVGNVSGWLTTILTRTSLNILRARAARPEKPAGVHVPDPIAVHADDAAPDPEQEALLAESVGLALMVVLEALTPPERVAFVLHDVFGVPFSEIGQLVGRSEQAARQLASRARRQVKEAGPSTPDVSLPQQRAIVDAFFTAARAGDFDPKGPGPGPSPAPPPPAPARRRGTRSPSSAP